MVGWVIHPPGYPRVGTQGGYPGVGTPGYYGVPTFYPGVPNHYPEVPRGREGSLGMHVPGSLVPGDPLTYTGWGYGVPRGCTTPGLGYDYQGVPRGPDGNPSGYPGVPLGGGTLPMKSTAPACQIVEIESTLQCKYKGSRLGGYGIKNIEYPTLKI